MKYRTDLIKAPKPGDDKFFGDVDTRGIIETVLYADPKSGIYTKEFARSLKGKTLIDTCRNIWEFVKTQIPYVLDERGYQWIKSPGRLWAEKSGDCKSFAVFIASCLKNLKIPYGYRFASYDPGDKTPTHVYVYAPGPDGEIILDAVWKGPFNSQKKFEFKTDYLMAKTYYLGDTEGHVPGVLKLTKPIDQLTEGELDLLLARQRMEIEKKNAARVGSPFLHKYDESLKTINHCIRNVDKPEVIDQVADSLIGKTKKIDPKTGKTKKTAAGKLLKKVATGIKKGAKAITKVVTAPLRLVAKGAMEIYLPKSAIFFLYLFTPPTAKLPDMMARKKKKAEKFKNFVVKGLGMKDNHFMAIIRNNLTKRFGKSPESFLAEKLKAAVAGLGNIKAALRKKHGGKMPTFKREFAKKHLHPRVKPGWNSTFKQRIDPVFISGPGEEAADSSGTKAAKLFNKADGKKLLNAGAAVASGNFIGAAMQAIQWLISKIVSLLGGKADQPDKISAEDFPDVDRDSANAFQYQDLKNDYSTLTSDQQSLVKETATNLIEKNISDDDVRRLIEEKLNFLSPAQKGEIFNEVNEGPEKLDEEEQARLAAEIKKNNNGDDSWEDTGGGSRGGFCDC